MQQQGIHSVTPRNTAVHWTRHGCTGCHQLYEPQSFHGNKEVSPPGGQSEAGEG
ncbi:hypothetical protein T05_15121 [Trichinella murrelli]|uniref:Uncharacterized protein n=1 Tax=Trichinella murrelli TaxID=144512 RepID=A0A0V0SRS9_9BILA|nr:hypothetical protein T05_15121 [Trichinella murrelli]